MPMLFSTCWPSRLFKVEEKKPTLYNIYLQLHINLLKTSKNGIFRELVFYNIAY